MLLVGVSQTVFVGYRMYSVGYSIMADAYLDYATLLGMDSELFNELMNKKANVAAPVLGGFAELYFRDQHIDSNPNISAVNNPSDHDRSQKYDWIYQYKGHPIRVEVKSIQKGSESVEYTNMGEKVHTGNTQLKNSDPIERTLPDGTVVSPINTKKGNFDILAVCLFRFENEWVFVFAKNEDLPETTSGEIPKDYHHLFLENPIPVQYPTGDLFTTDLEGLMDEIVQERENGTHAQVGQTMLDSYVSQSTTDPNHELRHYE